ncbi:hypothetical protein O9G_003739 [Rozella allomycis CSF55]|uniref:Uncharacterized protein n=1 Tax=Rozella allomycis (strain CSF55) TaxID=988480 RepID=A0A075AVJ2_ROZAC|nr:hypothetical protein O9G_003739 [Rozella allomycis CSF55]|eukprot:EPZ34140.1 hypothetical protein O9G_003739 [Rozella allomycis CSF55]
MNDNIISEWTSAVVENKIESLKKLILESPFVQTNEGLTCQTPNATKSFTFAIAKPRHLSNIQLKVEKTYHPSLSKEASKFLGFDTSGLNALQWSLLQMDYEEDEDVINKRKETIIFLAKVTPEDGVNQKWGSYSNTSLHLAAFLGEKDLVKVLLDNNADANIVNMLGFNALDVVAPDDEDTIKILKRYVTQNSSKINTIRHSLSDKKVRKQNTLASLSSGRMSTAISVEYSEDGESVRLERSMPDINLKTNNEDDLPKWNDFKSVSLRKPERQSVSVKDILNGLRQQDSLSRRQSVQELDNKKQTSESQLCEERVVEEPRQIIIPVEPLNIKKKNIDLVNTGLTRQSSVKALKSVFETGNSQSESDNLRDDKNKQQINFNEKRRGSVESLVRNLESVSGITKEEGKPESRVKEETKASNDKIDSKEEIHKEEIHEIQFSPSKASLEKSSSMLTKESTDSIPYAPIIGEQKDRELILQKQKECHERLLKKRAEMKGHTAFFEQKGEMDTFDNQGRLFGFERVNKLSQLNIQAFRVEALPLIVKFSLDQQEHIGSPVIAFKEYVDLSEETIRFIPFQLKFAKDEEMSFHGKDETLASIDGISIDSVILKKAHKTIFEIKVPFNKKLSGNVSVQLFYLSNKDLTRYKCNVPQHVSDAMEFVDDLYFYNTLFCDGYLSQRGLDDHTPRLEIDLKNVKRIELIVSGPDYTEIPISNSFKFHLMNDSIVEFYADTPEELLTWYQKIDSVLDELCRRNKFIV